MWPTAHSTSSRVCLICISNLMPSKRTLDFHHLLVSRKYHYHLSRHQTLKPGRNVCFSFIFPISTSITFIPSAHPIGSPSKYSLNEMTSHLLCWYHHGLNHHHLSLPYSKSRSLSSCLQYGPLQSILHRAKCPFQV